ncbi:MAG: ATP-binding protein [Proteobacteria bacterium]|nr:ATP-binding protein [Pseudomonadota bacterium]
MKFSVFPIGAPPTVHPVKKTNRSLLPDELVMTSKSFPASGIVVLYGPSGSGKTRLMQAAARYASAQKGLDILHCCVLDLIQEMVDAIKKGTYHAFRTSLMRLDALFIDNIWLLQSSRQTALAVFSLFEAFADKGGLVMIASDLPPSLLSEWAPAKR